MIENYIFSFKRSKHKLNVTKQAKLNDVNKKTSIVWHETIYYDFQKKFMWIKRSEESHRIRNGFGAN